MKNLIYISLISILTLTSAQYQTQFKISYSYLSLVDIYGKASGPSVLPYTFVFNSDKFTRFGNDGENENNRHTVLFVSKSHFEVSASNMYLQGLANSSQTYVVAIDTATGKLSYTLASPNTLALSYTLDLPDTSALPYTLA
jgi:hypothetical protein